MNNNNVGIMAMPVAPELPTKGIMTGKLWNHKMSTHGFQHNTLLEMAASLFDLESMAKTMLNNNIPSPTYPYSSVHPKQITLQVLAEFVNDLLECPSEDIFDTKIESIPFIESHINTKSFNHHTQFLLLGETLN